MLAPLDAPNLQQLSCLSSKYSSTHLTVRGLSQLPGAPAEYYTNLIKNFYDDHKDQSKSLLAAEQMLANMVKVSNPQFQVKMFYLVCARIIRLTTQLGELGVKRFWVFKDKLQKQVERSIFRPAPAATSPLLPSTPKPTEVWAMETSDSPEPVKPLDAGLIR